MGTLQVAVSTAQVAGVVLIAVIAVGVKIAIVKLVWDSRRKN